MFPKIDPKQMEKMMKQMGMQTENIDATEVVIRTAEKEIIISEPQVSKIKMGGQETFQIVGNVSERQKERFSDEDVKTVVEQSGISETEAKKALEETGGDLAEAIIRLKKIV
ncbi:MAG TPA: nascent polypeptide-associated complex protein [archaeon]|nr:nascent polypeptide-associated complex protein [archaeon]